MFTGCSRAVNFRFPSCFAAWRTRSRPLDPLSRLRVRHGLDCCVFSVVSGLPSTASADGFPSWVGCFAGTMPLFDSPLPCTRDLWLIAFALPPADYLRAAAGSPGSRAWSFSALATSVDEWSTYRGTRSAFLLRFSVRGLRLRRAAPHSRYRAPRCGLPYCLTPSAPCTARFRSSIPSLQIPLSNASSAASRLPSHGSGPGCFAIPSLYDSFIRYSMPVHPGAIQAGVPAPRNRPQVCHLPLTLLQQKC